MEMRENLKADNFQSSGIITVEPKHDQSAHKYPILNNNIAKFTLFNLVV